MNHRVHGGHRVRHERMAQDFKILNPVYSVTSVVKEVLL